MRIQYLVYVLGMNVSMKSGLDGRNNERRVTASWRQKQCLNEVRPRWPEQSPTCEILDRLNDWVSMKSGLDGRNNLPDLVATVGHDVVSMKSGLDGRNNCAYLARIARTSEECLNEVRPRWPEQ